MPADSSPSGRTDEAFLEVDLKDRRLAAILAWILPGLGHFYQGRSGKAALFFICIVGTFAYGLFIGQGRVVYASGTNPFTRPREFFERWHYVCQVGVGLPALPAYVQALRVESGKVPLFGFERHFMRPPRKNLPEGAAALQTKDRANNILDHPHELAKWQYQLGDRFEIGTVFTVIAGLLNILAIYDAYGGPLVIPPRAAKTAGKEARE
jgi:hypothetical protein